MKKFMTGLVTTAFLAALALPAFADVDVLATVDKHKDKTVTEDVDIVKFHEVRVKQLASPTNSAEAQAVKNDINRDNTIDETETPVNKTATINAATGDGSSGVVSLNQSPGSINNQGNATSVAVTDVGQAFVHAEASVEKDLYGNTVGTYQPNRTNLIDAALTGVTGILNVNQSAGNINNQNNATGLAVGANSIAALSEADLGMDNYENTSFEDGGLLTDTLTNGALQGSFGIVNVNQSSGCMNNQANVVSVSATVNPGVF
ncbi:MAG: hypothetical protein V1736_09530 [Pseudomonadota bacterium]